MRPLQEVREDVEATRADLAGLVEEHKRIARELKKYELELATHPEERFRVEYRAREPIEGFAVIETVKKVPSDPHEPTIYKVVLIAPGRGTIPEELAKIAAAALAEWAKEKDGRAET